jgi:hypothetical protein
VLADSRGTSTSPSREGTGRDGLEPRPHRLRRARYELPGLALGIAAVAWALTAAAAATAQLFAGWPPVALAVALVVLTMTPLALAVAIAGRRSGDGVGAPAGFVRGSWTDAVLGAFAGLVVRALVEIVAPTGGASGLARPAPALAVTLIAAVLIAPIVEEAYFRGLVQGAASDVLANRMGRRSMAVVAVAISTAAFVAMHAIVGGLQPALLLGATLTGIACGTLAAVTGRICAPIAAHVVYNGVGALVLLVQL